MAVASEDAAIKTGINSSAGAKPKCAIVKSALGALTAFW
jgi:hypothetical protein